MPAVCLQKNQLSAASKKAIILVVKSKLVIDEEAVRINELPKLTDQNTSLGCTKTIIILPKVHQLVLIIITNAKDVHNQYLR